MPTEPKVAIVTGASRGIGAAIAERLASDGFSVVVNYVGSVDAAQQVVEKIVKGGGSATAIKADVSKSAEMSSMFEHAVSQFGGVDVLVNNAGIMKLSPLAETTDEDFDQQISINLKGTFNGLRLAAKHLRDGGRIISFSSTVVGLAPPTYGVYAATKGATEAMTHILAKELGKRHITANVVAPGPVETELFLNGKDKAEIDQTVGRTPLGRLGKPDDIARVVSFLAGPDGAWVNGQVIRANGGML